MPDLKHDPSESAIPIELDGEKWWLDFGRISIRQAMVIQGYTGKTIEDLFGRFAEITADSADDVDNTEAEDADPDGTELLKIVLCFWWLMRAQCGIREPIADADGPLMDFTQALMKGMLDTGLLEAEEADGPDPTGLSQSSPPDDPKSAASPTPTGTTPRRRAKPATATTG